MRSFSILVCTYPAPPSLEILLNSLERQNWQPEDELIFVDNGVSEPRKTEVKRLVAGLSRYLKTHYVEEPAPGPGPAQLAGFRHAAGDWILRLDDDNELMQGCVETLRDYVQGNDDVGGICPSIYAVWQIATPSWLQRASVELLSVNHCGEFSPDIARKKWTAGEGIPMRPPGGGMVIRAEVAKEYVRRCDEHLAYVHIGRRRNSLLGCTEDLIAYDLTVDLGYSTAYVPEAGIKHHLPEKRASIKYLCDLAFWMSASNAMLHRMEKRKERLWSRVRLSFFALAAIRKRFRFGLRLTIIAFAQAFGLLSGLWRARIQEPGRG
jgi:glycosyltransferase involved in cell wall biosynthesis